MEYLVIGKEHLDYLSKKSGKQVKGYTLHLTYQKENCEGVAAMIEFVNEQIGESVNVGESVLLSYNKFGKVDRVL